MKKIFRLVGLSLVVVGLFVGAYLVSNTNKSTDVRKSAYYGSSNFVFLPTEVSNLGIGDTFVFELMVNVGDKQLNGLDIRLIFDKSRLSVVGNPQPLIAASSQDYSHYLFHNTGDVMKNQLDTNAGTIVLSGAVSGSGNEVLPTGAVHLMKVTFRAEAQGDATVDIDDSYSNILTGNTTNPADPYFQFAADGVIYQVLPQVVCGANSADSNNDRVCECNNGFGDCNGDISSGVNGNGCEVNLQTDINNCGQCNRACSDVGVVSKSCTTGLCNSSCKANLKNENKPVPPNADDGCEACGYSADFVKGGGITIQDFTSYRLAFMDVFVDGITNPSLEEKLNFNCDSSVSIADFSSFRVEFLKGI